MLLVQFGVLKIPKSTPISKNKSWMHLVPVSDTSLKLHCISSLWQVSLLANLILKLLLDVLFSLIIPTFCRGEAKKAHQVYALNKLETNNRR